MRDRRKSARVGSAACRRRRPARARRGVVTVVRSSGATRTCSVSQRGVAAGAVPADITRRWARTSPAEDLGEQVLEGLLVQGTRMTDTIPAGAMGNERPIEIVTERWYSKDIDAMVLQRFSDPRFGETIYRLVNVVLGEPSPDSVPSAAGLRARDGRRRARPVSRRSRHAGPARSSFELRREPGAPAPRRIAASRSELLSSPGRA